MQESIVFLVRVQCRRKEISRSLSHLLMSFLFYLLAKWFYFQSKLTLYHLFTFTMRFLTAKKQQ